MSCFGLDPESVVARVGASGAPPRVPSLAESLLRGTIGFTLVSVAGFAPWALGGRLLQRSVGEAGMYAACAATFIGLSGLVLHRLIIGPGSRSRFYKLFGVSFALYSAAWIAVWMGLHRWNAHAAGLLGLFAGSVLMGGVIAWAFDERRATPAAIAALFVPNAIGYFVGGLAEGALAKSSLTLAMLSWGGCYGIGLGAGLGLAFYLCQKSVRARLSP
jgi:hypothetical protein